MVHFRCSNCKKRISKKGLCPKCKSEYNKTWYKKNRKIQLERVNRNNQRYKQEAVEYIRQVKDVPCTDCGGKFPSYVMDFDHLGTKPKYMNVSRMAFRRCTIDAIKAEIEKCEVVCSNCHRIRTHSKRP